MQGKDTEKNPKVSEQVLALSIFFKLIDTIEEIKSGHIVGVRLSHLDQIDLEALIEFFPHRILLVLGISK